MKKFLGEEHLDRAVKSLLLKMNTDGNLKVDKTSISAELSEGVKIAEIAGISIYAPEGTTPEEIDQIKQELVDEISNKLSLSGGSMSGNINMQNNRVTGLPYTQSSSDAVSLSQMRNEISSYIVFTSSSSFTLKVTDNVKSWDGTIEYSTNAVNWSTWSGGVISSVNNKIYLRGLNNTTITTMISSPSDHYSWVLTGSGIECLGNLENILDYKSVEKGLHPKMGYSAFNSLFKNCTALTRSPYLGSLIISSSGYGSMFYGCTSLTTAPELPATELATGCYALMFLGCTSLVSAPELPADNLGSLSSCYSDMFSGCTSLVYPPHVLPARAVGNLCYIRMFAGCTALTSTPKILAVSVGGRSFEEMFRQCTSLISISPFAVRTMMSQAFKSMFYGCASLTSLPSNLLPATALVTECYISMFSGCKSLVDVPFDLLPATTLNVNCYASMFSGCTALKIPPALPATTLFSYCYSSMFSGCTSLEVLPALPATTLQSYCYQNMFYGCTSIKFSTTKVGNYVGSYRVPTSGTGTVSSNSLYKMIEGTGGTAQSISINTTLYTSNSKLYPNGLVENPDGSVTWLTYTPLDNTPTQGSLNGVTSDGIYQAIQQGGGGASALVDLTDVDVNNVSEGQGIAYDSTSQKWKNVNMPQEGTVVPVVLSGVTIAVIDNTPIYAPEGITNVELNDLDDVEISDPQDHQTLTYDATSDKWINSTASGSAVVSQVVNAGVPLAVIDDTIIYSPYDDVTKINGAIAIIANDSFELSTKGLEVYWDGTLEYSTDKLLWTTWDGTAISSNNAGILYLRGSNNTVITGNDLNAMWQITTNASEISCLGNIENLLDYQSVSQSIHPTMSAYCFYNLFFGWVNLVEGPELPATSLAAHCYDSMFENCSALVKAPELPSTVLAEYCYAGMFYDCASLKAMPSLPATILANSCYFSMFNGCTALKEINELPATVLADSCYTYMFKNCSSLVNAMDSLPATALTFDCYRQMFYGCSALKSAPAIAATTVTAGLNILDQQSGCCVEMFKNCSALETLPVLAPVLLADYSYMNMFNGCSKIKLSTSKIDDYTLPYRLPYIGQGVNATDALTGMFVNTTGTFVGTPSINTTYYTLNILVYPDSHKIYPSGLVTWNAASLIFDSVPTEGSMNPVTSDGIYLAIQEGGGGGGASALVDLTDTSISSPTNGQVLTYDSTNNKWKNLAVPQSTQVNSDWNSSSGVSEILNKPTIPQEGTVVQLLQSGTPIAIIDGITIYAPTPSSGS